MWAIAGVTSAGGATLGLADALLEIAEGDIEAGSFQEGECNRAFFRQAKFSFADSRALDNRVFDFLQLRW
jgi:hypothetical protein